MLPSIFSHCNAGFELLAKGKGLKGVEPFVHMESGFGIFLSRADFSNQLVKNSGYIIMLRLDDDLYLESWEEQVRGQDFAPFEIWKVFLKAPRVTSSLHAVRRT